MTIEKLKLRVKTGISNPEPFLEQQELFNYAINETNGIVGNKDLAEAFYMDIAYYRFLLLADVTPRESDETNYKLALTALKSANNKAVDQTTGEETTHPPVMVAQRKTYFM